jgi:uncharacterized protein YodC (DUF2158 family)
LLSGYPQAFKTHFLIAQSDNLHGELKMTGTEFVKGDTVRLKSGGPIMTVSNTGDRLGEHAVWCMWFDPKNNRTEDTFPPEALEKVTKPTGGIYVGRTGRG